MRRLQLGRQLRVRAYRSDGVDLEGPARLRPGQLVDLVLEERPGASSPTKRALVVSWQVMRLGKDGPTYTGECRWAPATENALPERNTRDADFSG